MSRAPLKVARRLREAGGITTASSSPPEGSGSPRVSCAAAHGAAEDTSAEDASTEDASTVDPHGAAGDLRGQQGDPLSWLQSCVHPLPVT